ncbi:ABC transporter permease [Herbiconiux sp. KACC 21604]|uniref:ABC transporter permease n=1 Tax=unclassified Herbiconiux TaxID=2618217 RepID=UPI001491E678|nr:ABC transporter permease [Herbiconiux sp. SALV-R1]QJU53796.1 ABC transporter permease [Herbiconiux sp. SALV-R1]WPO84804.1 ABC transporter permease [Herbiconiux sp. KACC 21604]
MRTLDRRRWLLTASVVAAVLLVAGALILVAGADPLVGLRGLAEGVSSSPYRVGEVLVGAVPIGIVALTLIPALRAGVFSVGAEGQIVVGAIAATGAVFAVDRLFGGAAPSLVLWPVGLLAGAAGGAATALLPAFLAVRWRVNEILSTLLLNYLAAGFLGWTLRTWLATPEETATPQSAKLPEAASLPALIPGTRAHWGILLVVVIAVVLVLWNRSAASTRLTVFASRPKLALRLGATRARTVYSTMAISGIGAGAVGWIQVAGVNDRLLSSVSGGVGFSGIAVALLGGLAPVGIVVAALFFSALTAGAVGMQSATGTVPASIAEVIKGVLLVGVACIAAYQRKPAAVVQPAGGREAADEPAVPAAEPPDAAGAREATVGTLVEAEHEGGRP